MDPVTKAAQPRRKAARELSPKRRRDLLERAGALGNVSLACAEFGVSRTAFYKYRKLQRAGKLVASGDTPPARQPHPQTTAPETVGQLVALARKCPEKSGRELSECLMERHGVSLSTTTACKILLSQNLGRADRERLHRARLHESQQSAPAFVPLPIPTVKSPEKSPEERRAATFALRIADKTVSDIPTLTEREAQPVRPGQKLCQFVFLLRKCGRLGPVYVHCVLDTYNAMAWARVSLTRKSGDAATFLWEGAVAFFAQHRWFAQSIETPSNRVFCAPPPRWNEKNRFERLAEDQAFFGAEAKTLQKREQVGIAGARRAFMPFANARRGLWNPQGKRYYSDPDNEDPRAIEWRQEQKARLEAARQARQDPPWHLYRECVKRCGIGHTAICGRGASFNSSAKRFHRTLRTEFFGSATRDMPGLTLEGLQLQLESWLIFYNQARPHPGYPNLGQPPAQRFMEFLTRSSK